jgi:hypothetical protein
MSFERVNMTNKQQDIVSTTPKRGRPKKTDIVSKKKGNRELRGRPAGDRAIMEDFKARMLNSPKSAKVLEAVFNAALDDNHKGQQAAWKLIIDRLAPVSSFEQVKQGGQTPQISINISSFGQPEIKAKEILDKVEVSDVEFKDINYEDE